MPNRQCRKPSAIVLCGIMCLFLWQASIYPVLGNGSDIIELLPYTIKEETMSLTNENNNVLKNLETTRIVVKRGETLWDLARKYLTTVNELVSLNQIKNPNQISEGQLIWVPNREIKLKIQDPQTKDIMVEREVVSKTPADIKPAEKVSYAPWWINVLRSIQLFEFRSPKLEPTIQTYEIFVNKDEEVTEKPPRNELTDVVDNRMKLAATMGVTGKTSENQIHSRGLGRLVTNDEVELLTRVIYGEARGEDFVGQVAVGAVVLNRLKDPRFPKTIQSIVYQSGAFTAVDDRQIHLDPDDQAYKAAEAALAGLDPTNGAIFYYNPRIATDQWIKTRTVIKRIGNHTFSI